jgi:hypothetical protein
MAIGGLEKVGESFPRRAAVVAARTLGSEPAKKWVSEKRYPLPESLAKKSYQKVDN